VENSTILILCGFVVTLIGIMTPIIKLNSSITKLNTMMENINCGLREGKEKQEKTDEVLQDHNIRIDRLEHKKG
jgi:hypothetical protein